MVNPNKTLLAVMEDAARAAGNVLLSLQPNAQRLPSRKDFLSDADLKSEKLILNVLKACYPDIPAFSEETGGKPVLSGKSWVVDPLDGTVNYFRKQPNWGVSTALVENSIPQAGVMSLPALDLLFAADTVSGTIKQSLAARTRLTLGVSTTQNLRESQVWTDHVKGDTEKLLLIFRLLSAHTLYPQIRLCFTASMVEVACGRIDGYVHGGPEPFDVAAAILIVERAGGKVTNLNGNHYDIFSKKTMIATNGHIHEPLLEVLNRR